MILNTLRAMVWATEVGLHRRLWILSPASKTRRSLTCASETCAGLHADGRRSSYSDGMSEFIRRRSYTYLSMVFLTLGHHGHSFTERHASAVIPLPARDNR
jgi:hypothetical protein